MTFREWRSLALQRRLFRRRMLRLPALLWVPIAVVWVLGAGWTLQRSLWVGDHRTWTALESDGEIIVLAQSEEEWVRRARARAEAGAWEPELSYWCFRWVGPWGPGTTGKAFVDQGLTPEQIAAMARSVDAAYRESDHGRAFPSAAARALEQPGTSRDVQRFLPYPALLGASLFVALYGLIPAALIAAVWPRRGEVAEYRRARGLCVRCRYAVGAGGVCPECGARR